MFQVIDAIGKGCREQAGQSDDALFCLNSMNYMLKDFSH